MSKFKKKNSRSDSHHSQFLRYVRQRLESLKVGIISDNILFIKEEPKSLDETTHFRVDFLVLTEIEECYEIFVIEVKSGACRRKHAFEQLEVTARFFTRGGWEHWLDEEINEPKEKDVWLQSVLVQCSIGMPLMLSDTVSAKRQKLGRYHAKVLAH